MDKAFNQYKIGLKEAQKIANGAKPGNFPRQMAVCEALKQQGDTAKQALKEFAIDLKTSIPVTTNVEDSPHATKLREWGFGRINKYHSKGRDLDTQYIRLLANQHLHGGQQVDS